MDTCIWAVSRCIAVARLLRYRNTINVCTYVPIGTQLKSQKRDFRENDLWSWAVLVMRKSLFSMFRKRAVEFLFGLPSTHLRTTQNVAGYALAGAPPTNLAGRSLMSRVDWLKAIK